MAEIGTYRGRYAGTWELDTTREGAEVMLVDVELIESGEVVTVKLYQSEKAKPHSDAKLMAMGWKGKGHPLDGMTEEVDVVVKDEEYQGKVTRKADIRANGSMKIKPFNSMSTTQKNDFLKRLTGVSAANGAKKPPAAQKPAVEDDDSLPF